MNSDEKTNNSNFRRLSIASFTTLILKKLGKRLYFLLSSVKKLEELMIKTAMIWNYRQTLFAYFRNKRSRSGRVRNISLASATSVCLAIRSSIASNL